MRLAALAVLVLFVPQDKSKRKLEWKAEAGSVLEYDVVDPRTSKPSGEIFFVFASELRRGIAVDRYADIGWTLLFRLPREEVKPGQVWEHAAYFFHEAAEATAMWGWSGASSIRPVQAKGRYILRKIDKDDSVWIDGEFELLEIRRDQVNNQLKLTVTKNKVGTVATSAVLSNGILTQGSFTIDAPRAQERVREKDEWKVADRRVRETKRIQFREAVKLDREKMAGAIEASLKKASAWIRKQQKPSGDFGPGRTLETERVETNLTGPAVRALLAAGAKPEDDAVQKALRSLKTNPGPRTPQTYANLVGAVPDAKVLRAAADTVLELRDRKSGAWAPSNRKGLDTPNVASTRHALEVLHAAGAPAPADVLRAIVDLLASLAADESDVEEVNLEFEESFRGIEIPDRKLIPASWRTSLERRPQADVTGSRDSKGHAISTLCALEALLLARATVALPETQRKAADAAVRKGLAWLQSTWTLRTPPPAEAPWSVRKPEHLWLVMRVFAALGVRTIDGSDWHAEGAYLLLRSQYEDGSWDSSGGQAMLDTISAVLFLTRAAGPLPAAQ